MNDRKGGQAGAPQESGKAQVTLPSMSRSLGSGIWLSWALCSGPLWGHRRLDSVPWGWWTEARFLSGCDGGPLGSIPRGFLTPRATSVVEAARGARLDAAFLWLCLASEGRDSPRSSRQRCWPWPWPETGRLISSRCGQQAQAPSQLARRPCWWPDAHPGKATARENRLLPPTREPVAGQWGPRRPAGAAAVAGSSL